MLRMVLILCGVVAIVFGVLGTRGQISKDRPRIFFPDMRYQPKYIPQGQSAYFADGRAMRPTVAGTVAYAGQDYFADAGYLPGPDPNFLRADDAYFRGIADPSKVNDKNELLPEAFVRQIPERAVKELGGFRQLLARGKVKFTQYCAVCHGESGYGGQGDDAHGIVGRYGMTGIASYHDDRLRSAPDGDLFNTITNGKGSMSPYGHQLKVADRWAVVGYVRALQYSQAADPNDVPPEARERLGVPKP